MSASIKAVFENPHKYLDYERVEIQVDSKEGLIIDVFRIDHQSDNPEYSHLRNPLKLGLEECSKSELLKFARSLKMISEELTFYCEQS